MEKKTENQSQKNKINAPKLIIGLGNPGEKYKKTYHNIGLVCVENLSNGEEFKNPAKSRKNLFEYTDQNGLKLAKTKTSMNESGRAVDAAVTYFKIKPADLIVAHDDSDITLGRYKLSFGSSSAGHHGVDSVIGVLGTKNFWRLRIGIRPQNTRAKALSFVLKKIKKDDEKTLNHVFEDIRTLLGFENDGK